MTSEKQKEIAERLGELLAQSNLEESVKELILDSLDEIPESMTVKLISALEEENDQIESAVTAIEKFITNQESHWSDVEEDQRSMAEKFLEDAAQTLDDQARIQELKETI